MDGKMIHGCTSAPRSLHSVDVTVDPMSSTRRAFLKETLLGTMFLAAARPLRVLATAMEEPPPPGFFSEEERAIITAAAQRLIGTAVEPDAPLIDVSSRADRFLAEEEPGVQEQMHLLLAIFNSQFAALVFSLKFSSFLDMNPQARDEYLEGWMTSRLGFRRTGFQALKRLCMSMYYTHPASYAGIGYSPLIPASEER